jgi:hypothetical protein
MSAEEDDDDDEAAALARKCAKALKLVEQAEKESWLLRLKEVLANGRLSPSVRRDVEDFSISRNHSPVCLVEALSDFYCGA